MADEKREGYPPAGGELVPMVFEAGGRASEEAEEFVRAYGHGLTLGDRARVLGMAWRQIFRVMQVGNAEMVISSQRPGHH